MAVGQHALDEFLAKMIKPPFTLPSCHRSPELVGLARRETCGNNSQFNDLLLEDGHAECSLKNALYRFASISHRFSALPALQVGVNHFALYRARPNNSHLDD